MKQIMMVPHSLLGEPVNEQTEIKLIDYRAS